MAITRLVYLLGVAMRMGYAGSDAYDERKPAMRWILRVLIVLCLTLFFAALRPADAHRGWRVGWGGGIRWGGYPVYGWRSAYYGFYGPRFSLGLGYRPYGWGATWYRPYAYPWYASTWNYPGYLYLDAWDIAPPVVYAYSPPSVINQPSVVVQPAAPVVPQENPAPPVQQMAQRQQADVEILPQPQRDDLLSGRIEVVVPDPHADVWFGQYRTKAKGRKRVFETPRLQPGKPYSYTVTVQWTEAGKPRTESRRIPVQLGDTVVADFGAHPAPPLPGNAQPQ